jgi:alkylation response protein AidB-like acyl-CoA dehydrogenase
MELSLDLDVERFRAELRDWIAAEAPPEFDDGSAAWTAKLIKQRLVCPQWPAEFGGQGMDATRLAVVDEEFAWAGVPRVQRGVGESLIGPAIMAHGTPEQQAYFLPRIISGQDVYCLAFSEPDHGSDLAAVTTRGFISGDDLVITGRKAWTAKDRQATRMFLLCRTGPGAGPQAGLSCVIIDCAAPGVTAQAVRQLSGAAGLGHHLIDDVRVPLFNVIGGVGNGWPVVMTTRGPATGAAAGIAHLGFEREFWALVETARKIGATADRLMRQQLAWAYTQVELIRYTELRTLAEEAEGRPPGPQAAVARLLQSEYHKRLGEVAMMVTGTDGLLRPAGDGYAVGHWQYVFLTSRGDTIAAGTSEIQRTVIGERVLGLPREPRA